MAAVTTGVVVECIGALFVCGACACGGDSHARVGVFASATTVRGGVGVVVGMHVNRATGAVDLDNKGT